MNILFVNYGDLRSNSMSHIAPYANGLNAMGHSCAVITETDKTSDSKPAPLPLFSHYTHTQLREGIEPFPDAAPADILHAWTPRENVRVSVEDYQSRNPSTRVIIHLEDNEEAILESVYQQSIEALILRMQSDNPIALNPRLSHPIEFKNFLVRADGISLISEGLKHLVPVPKLTYNFFPIIPQRNRTTSAERSILRDQLGINQNTKIIVFPGGITSSNRADIRDLYQAVAILNEEGIDCKIIKTGPSCEEFIQSFIFPLEYICTDLGFVDTELIPKLLDIADVLIQPGRDNPFNRDRFPCKIPEFLASGKPCLIPRCYAFTGDNPEPYCIFLDQSSPREIADRTKEILANPNMRQSLAQNARKLVLSRFAVDNNCERLLSFYKKVTEASPRERKGTRFLFPHLAKQKEQLEAEAGKLRQRLEDLNSENQRQNRTILDLIEETESLQEAIRQTEGKVERMKKSGSWQFTSPFRWVRRHFFDFNKKNKLQAVDRFTSEPLDYPIYKAPKAPPIGHPSLHKEYYRFVAKDERRINEFVESYCPPPKDSSPLISILLPVYEVEEKWLRRCIDSVVEQAYPHWELCISDDASKSPHIKKTIDEYLDIDTRIRAIYREDNGHISRATNSAFAIASGEYIALLDHDDELPPHALAKVAICIGEHPDAALIYSDEDKIDEQGLRHGPHFKSDFNYDLLLGCNAISHLGVYRRDEFEKVGGFRPSYEGAQDWDLALRVIEKIESTQICHIPEILYHWRTIQGSTAQGLSNKIYASSAQKRTIESHFERCKVKAAIESVDGFDWKVNYRLQKHPQVSIVIPTRNRVDLLRPCIESILQKTIYKNYEIIIIDNASTNKETLEYFAYISSINRIRVIRDERPFNFSSLNNSAIKTCESEYICLLNNDIEVITSAWLLEMMQHAQRPEIGMVGAKLLFPHDHVQHGGVILGIGGIAAHAYKYLHRDDDGHIHRAHLVSGYSAVTGACMLFRKSTWNQLGGFDEENLPISYNDIDFCLRAGEVGLRSIVTPFALLYHKESETRGDPSTDPEQRVQFSSEIEYMNKRWRSAIERDPFYNPNLTKDREDFSYNIN